MNKFFLLLFCAISLSSHAQVNYPTTKQIPVTDDYFGTKVTDNYRWLEDMKNPEVETWFKAQAAYTNSVLQQLPGRDKLFNQIMELSKLKPADYNGFFQRGNNLFYLKTTSGDKVASLYMRTLPNGAETLLLNPATYKEGKTYSIQILPSPNGKYIAVGFSEDGAEVGECRILDVKTRQLLPEVISPIWSIADSWTNDSKAITYNKLQTADNQSPNFLMDIKCMLHVLGTDTAGDRVLISRVNNPELPIKPEHWLHVSFSDDNQYMILAIESTNFDNFTYYAKASEINNKHINWKPLTIYEDQVRDITFFGNRIFFLTHKNAPNFCIKVTDADHPDFEHAKTVVAESKKVMKNLTKTKNYLFYKLSNGINAERFCVNPKTFSTRKVALPEGENGAWNLNSQENDKQLIIVDGWIIPKTIYEYDAVTNKLEKSKWLNPAIVYPRLSDFVVKEVEVKSHDGVMVPLSIVYSKNIKMDGSNVVFLAGYGAYGISTTPFFWEPIYSLCLNNVILAVAHVPGGGEKGEAWHQAGMKSTKANTWKDFIACAEYLVSEKYTSPKKIIGNGMSMGGILIGNAIAERPDLFGAAIVEVGCTNTLREEQSPNGANQIPEIGTISNKEDAQWLYAMDAQHKIKKGVKYPAVFVRTGYTDPRISPWMPGKFAATLQNNSVSGQPALFYVNFENGHFTEDREIVCREFADMYAFAFWQTGLPGFEIKK